METNSALPLDDLLVVELGDTIAPAYTGKLLAELGATVIRIDALDGGALYRAAPLVGNDQTGLKVGAPYLHLNRNKKSICLDVSTPEGGEILRGLLARADVLIDGLGLDRLSDLGHSHQALLDAYPALVIASITPFGLSGPYRDLHASDLAIVALGGLLNMVGFPEREPLQLGGSQMQYAAGLSAFTAVMAAVMYRDRSSEGQLIDVSMLETVAFVEWKSGAYFEADGRTRYRVGNHSHWLVLPASDGHVALVYQDDSFPGLQTLTGLEALHDDRFLTRAGRGQYADELREILSPWFASRRKLDIYHEGQAHGIPLGFVANVEDLLASGQYEARAFWQTVDHPAAGPAQYPGVPYHLSGVTLPAGRAPVPGEHTSDVLRSVLDGSDDWIDHCRRREVV